MPSSIHYKMKFALAQTQRINQMRRCLLLALCILFASKQPAPARQDNSMPTVAPLPATSTGVSNAPGADAMMTQDLLLVSPDKGKQSPKPLQDFVGNTLTLSLEQSDIILDGLRGMMITVTNDTSRPLVVDGDSTKATSGGHNYSSAPVSVVQKSVLPSNAAVAKVFRLTQGITEGGLSIGAIPTVKDYITMKKPIRKRYGPDEHRRLVEASRFGKRILWPHQKTDGVLYFKTHDTFTGAKLEIPVHTLFDKPDSAVLF